MKLRLVTLLALFGLALAPVSLLAQTMQTPQSSQVPCCPAPPQTTVPCCPPSTGTTAGGGGFMADVNPYGGYVWPLNLDGLGDFKGSQVWGVRGGIFAT